MANSGDIRSERWLLAFVLFLLASLTLLLVGGSFAHSADAKGKPQARSKPVKVNVKFLKTSQQAASTSKKVKLRVKATGRKNRKASVSINLEVRQPWSDWTAAGRKSLRIKAGKKRLITVKLNGPSLALLNNCGTPSFRLSYKSRSAGKRRSGKASSGKLKGQASRCALPADVDLSKAAACDFIAPAGNPCLQPFPNDYNTKPDPSSETGLRVDFKPDATPRNQADKNVEVNVLNQSDGFSPGQSISVHIPGMENQAAFDQTAIVPLTDMGQAFAPQQPVLLLDAETGERQLIWGEMDSLASEDKDRNLIIRPGKNLKNGHRYLVVLRNIKDSAGNLLPAPAGYRLYRDNQRTDNSIVEARRNQYEKDFELLAGASVERPSMYLHWSFTVASAENLTGRMISIRDRAFASLGDTNLTDNVPQGVSPDFTITESLDNPPGQPELARRVRGTFEVPCYLNQTGCPTGSTFDLDANQKPIRMAGNTFTARFQCNIPASSISGGNVVQTARPSLYGHGLFNEFFEANSTNVRELGNDNGVMVCSTDWIGMSSSDDGNPFRDDIPSAIAALADASKFPTIPDRLQQSFLNFLFLGRMLIHPDGLTDDPAFNFNGNSVIDTSGLFYYGNSQGGIAGGALTAVATDFTRSVLYVPGMNYSTLLPRSSDFSDFALILYPSYPRQLERPLLFSLLQMMWDRGEPNGYANNMTDKPLPGTPAHKVMLVMAYGDHEVANVSTEVEARTIGAPLRLPAVDSNRQPAGMIDPFYSHEALGNLAGPAADGNAFFIWDTGPKRTTPTGNPPGDSLWGTDPAPLTNTAPNNSFGQNPHDTVIEESPLARKQIADFLKVNGKVTNPCGLNPCYAAGWMGFP